MKTTGSVQEKNGRFYFVVNLYDANGKRKIKWISTGLTVRGNKRKAESMLREVLLHYDETGELPTGRGGAYEKVDAKTAKPLPQHLQPVSKSEMLFLDYLNEWVQVHKASIQPATFISYNRMITGRITQYFEPLGLKLCEVTPQVLDEFQEKILLEGYTTNTVIHYHAIFGKAFKDAVRKDYLETNPMLKVDRPKKNSFRPNFYSKDEVQQLLEVSQDDPLHLCILITAYYGLRRSEVLGLKWSSIDFERKSITINHMAMKHELGSAEPYFAATSPVLDLTVIRPDDAPHILACFDEADEGIGISENEPLGFRYNPKQVVKLMGQRYLVGPVIFHRFDEDGNFASLTMGDMYTIQKYLEAKSVTLMIDRDKLTCICID